MQGPRYTFSQPLSERVADRNCARRRRDADSARDPDSACDANARPADADSGPHGDADSGPHGDAGPNATSVTDTGGSF